MWNTYSSTCMHQVILAELAKIPKEMKRSPSIGFNALIAVTIAASGIDHWWQDTESVREPNKIAREFSELWKETLCRRDKELKIDADTRSAIVVKLALIAEDWAGSELGSRFRLKFQ